jgi:hypothetical protein
MKDTSEVHLADVSFVGNSAEFGGGVSYENIDQCVMTSLLFVNNIAGDKGGAVWLDSSSHVDIEGADFTNNAAVSSSGAAIYTKYSTLSIALSKFTGNSAAAGAGAVFWEYHSGMTEPAGMRDNTNVFTLNTALYGNDWVRVRNYSVLKRL